MTKLFIGLLLLSSVVSTMAGEVICANKVNRSGKAEFDASLI